MLKFLFSPIKDVCLLDNIQNRVCKNLQNLGKRHWRFTISIKSLSSYIHDGHL